MRRVSLPPPLSSSQSSQPLQKQASTQSHCLFPVPCAKLACYVGANVTAMDCWLAHNVYAASRVATKTNTCSPNRMCLYTFAIRICHSTLIREFVELAHSTLLVTSFFISLYRSLSFSLFFFHYPYLRSSAHSHHSWHTYIFFWRLGNIDDCFQFELFFVFIQFQLLLTSRLSRRYPAQNMFAAKRLNFFHTWKWSDLEKKLNELKSSHHWQ